MSELLSAFAEAARRNQAAVHGPVDVAQAGDLLGERVVELGGGGSVAVPASDPVLDEVGAWNVLQDMGVQLVAPDRPDWRDAVASASVGVTGCVAAVAETGTVAVACGPGAPRSVSLLPDAHLCLVPGRLLVERFEDALGSAVAEGVPPNLVWISGPSRSADIEKQITLGVHGPRTVELVLVAGSG